MFSLEVFAVSITWWYPVAFGFGVIVGSFLNVFVYRFHTGKSLSGRSHCLSCGTQLQWYELFPLVSYLGLRGRCRSCGCRIPSRYFLVELLTGLLFVATLTVSTDIITILLLWVVVALLVVIVVYDLYHFIIPDALTAAVTGVLMLLLGYGYLTNSLLAEDILVSILAALGGSAFFLFLWLISKGAWLGFGDVKLAFPLGLLVGAPLVFSFVVLSFWIGAAVSLLLIAWVKVSRGKALLHLRLPAITIKSAVPFAPFLVASSLVVFFTHFNVLELFYFI